MAFNGIFNGISMIYLPFNSTNENASSSQIASGQIFNMDAIGELADLLMVRMLVIRKRGVTTHLTWPSCILIYVNKLVNMQITAGRRFFANSRNSTNSPTATRLRLCRLVSRYAAHCLCILLLNVAYI